MNLAGFRPLGSGRWYPAVCDVLLTQLAAHRDHGPQTRRSRMVIKSFYSDSVT